MPKYHPSKVLICACLFATFFLAGCERKGVDSTGNRAKPDPRLVKNFSAGAPWFCAIPTEYSEGSGKSSKIVSGLVVATGEDKKSTYESLTKACASAATAPKTQCTAILKAGTEKCVGASTFNAAPPTTGIWRCDLSFFVNDQEEKLESVGHTTANGAIAEAFKKCAELKDACAKAMMVPKMVCQDLNAANPIPAKSEAQRRLSRKPRI